MQKKASRCHFFLAIGRNKLIVPSVTEKRHLENDMKKRKYFKIRTREDDPMVIKRVDNHHTSYTFEQRMVTGVYYRVHPSIADYPALCMMQHRVEKFAPAIGNGVIIRADVLKALDATE
jgi:hypothetical protein